MDEESSSGPFRSFMSQKIWSYKKIFSSFGRTFQVLNALSSFGYTLSKFGHTFSSFWNIFPSFGHIFSTGLTLNFLNKACSLETDNWKL